MDRGPMPSKMFQMLVHGNYTEAHKYGADEIKLLCDRERLSVKHTLESILWPGTCNSNGTDKT